MPPSKGPLWSFFLPGEKQNSSHIRAHCLGCLEKRRPSTTAIELDEKGNRKALLMSDLWVSEACAEKVGQVLGVKDAMVAHILGKGGVDRCPNASAKARKVAKQTKDEIKEKNSSGKRSRETSSEDESAADSSDEQSQRKATKRKLLAKVEKSMTQPQLKVFRGIQVPFSDEQKEIVQRQFLRATISANLPFRWVEDAEVAKLFLLFRSSASDVLPSRLKVSGQLLDDEDARVMKELKARIKGEYAVISSDGWKDMSRDSVNGVSLTVNGNSYLIELIKVTAHQKDGDAMCEAFLAMIDCAEKLYCIIIIAFCCDNDGGSQKGRKDLVMKRPWLFGIPCCAHQFQLVLGDYFKENDEAAATAEEATDLIGWVLNHQRVRSVFNATQEEISGKVLTFLVANLTRWTTHLIAFARLGKLKDALRQSVILKRKEIIDAQVGAEKNRQKRQKLEDDAAEHCDLIDNGDFWRRLKAVCDDLEPICLGLNMNQTDAMRADQAVLTFAGIFLHFQKHTNTAVAAGMKKRIEKRWKALDQPLFILALVLNPFEGMTRFGDQAGVTAFTLNTIVLDMYRRVHSRPPPTPRSNEDEAQYQETQLRKEKEVSDAFMSYLSSSGVFADWEKNKAAFQRVNGDNPIAMWKAFLTTPGVRELADLAIRLLRLSVNQAGLERNFSDLKIKKSAIRNRIQLPRLEKMAKVGADIRASNANAGFVEERGKRKNHDSERVGELLAVPRHAELLNHVEVSADSGESSSSPSVLVRSRRGWRSEMAKWARDEHEKEVEADEQLTSAMYGAGRSKWLPRSLELLFGGRKEPDVVQQMERIRRRQAYTEEARLMELMVDEEEGEVILDDGELEGSGDEFTG